MTCRAFDRFTVQPRTPTARKQCRTSENFSPEHCGATALEDRAQSKERLAKRYAQVSRDPTRTINGVKA